MCQFNTNEAEHLLIWSSTTITNLTHFYCYHFSSRYVVITFPHVLNLCSVY